jgi:hypothetical protein
MRRLCIAFCTLALWLALSPAVLAQAIPYKPGRYSWKVEGGQLQLVAAQYTNRNSFDNRAYTFYFETADKKQLYIVPVAGAKPGDTAFTLTSSAGGEWLFADIALHRQDGALHLIKVKQDTPKGWDEPGNLTIERFLLKKGDEEEFPYQFVYQSKTVTPDAPRVNADTVLQQQLKSANR